MSDLKKAALEAAEQDLHVFPIKPGSKGGHGEYLVPSWKDYATPDPTQIEYWWDKNPNANIGVACEPSDLAVIDIDDLASKAVLEAERGPLPATWVATTPRGGEHHVYLGDIKTTNHGQLGAGIDTRGRGGYFVLPPSVRPEGLYAWRSRERIALLPEDLAERAEQRREREEPGPTTGQANDRWGQRVLDGEIAKVAVAPEGQRNGTLFEAACNIFEAVKGGHLDEEVARAALRSVGERIGLEPSEVRGSLESAWDRTQGRGPTEPLRAAESAHEALAIREDDDEGSETYDLMGLDDLANVPAPSFIIDRRVPEGLTALIGKPKSGKSFLAVDWACTVAALTGPVIYFTGEGRKGLARRILAWAQAHPGADLSRLNVVNTAPQLVDPAHAAMVYATVRKVRPTLIVIDTMARATVGQDENDGSVWSRAIQVADNIRDTYDTSTLMVHHTNAAGTRARGHSSLDGAVDASWKATDDEQSGIIDLSCIAMKDDAVPAPLVRKIRPAPNGSAYVSPSEYGDGK